MGSYLSEQELARLAPAEEAAFQSPVPTQMITNCEFNPLPQTEQQRKVEGRLKDIADTAGRKLGLDRRGFLRTGCGMAAAFVAMNDVYGPLFKIDAAEAAEPDAAAARSAGLSKQFIFDDQLHFVRDDYSYEGLLGLGHWAAENWNPAMKKEAVGMTLERYKFANFLREIYFDSDTKIGLLSGAPFDDPSKWLLSNDQIKQAADTVNRVAGSRRLLYHSLITPKQPGWMDEVDRVIADVHPTSWKGYTIGDPLAVKTTRYPWRLDDETLMYPFYEKAVRAGITNICIHKGLMPRDYETSTPNVWHYATVEDLPKAAKDWPQINFIIYHSALRPFLEDTQAELDEFERTGYIRWVSDLAAIPDKHGVKNVYAEIGTSFAVSAVSNPRFCAAFLGTLVKGVGYDHILWGTDSVWYGSPQWQIEAFRRLEIPEDMQKKHGFAPLGAADGQVKGAILGYNGARLYALDLRAAADQLPYDGIAQRKAAYLDQGEGRSNTAYGYVVPA
ncbi:amidohydrolase family protein [Rhodopila globiformis]|uniref:Amidohydrolase n=1 Tax=Rhodopila globiformis TaxID=1071 RepID=A0A2S6MV53_RHOGL|nr:amidohydrolase family protein [Rhodopila globiformis]PPQ26246.1 amidohydrolase [Rhodopila globiformis]